MWEPANKNGIPNEHDQFHARRAISQLQMELSTAMDLLPAAEVYVAGILRSIEERWAWLAPVRRVPFEIFSVIFIMAAEKNWRSAASVAGVCRFWRDVALATPQAWNFLDLQSNPPPEIASMFFQRSGRCLIHLTVPWVAAPSQWSEYMTLVAGITHRMECLVVTTASRELVLEDYQNLTRLSIGDTLNQIPLDYLDITRFPRLRYFDGAFSKPEVPQGANPCPRFPRIEHLIITTDSESAWLDAIRACSQTLTGLYINIGDKASSHPNPFIDLAQLKHLKIRKRWDSHRPWFFNAKTLNLETYDPVIEPKMVTVQVDLNTVTELHCPDVNNVDLSQYPTLRQVRMIGDHCEALCFIDKLRRDYEACPTLERIVVGDWDGDGLRKIARNLRKRNLATGVELKVVSTSTIGRAWPGDILISCGGHMPCYIPKLLRAILAQSRE